MLKARKENLTFNLADLEIRIISILITEILMMLIFFLPKMAKEKPTQITGSKAIQVAMCKIIIPEKTISLSFILNFLNEENMMAPIMHIGFTVSLSPWLSPVHLLFSWDSFLKVP